MADHDTVDRRCMIRNTSVLTYSNQSISTDSTRAPLHYYDILRNTLSDACHPNAVHRRTASRLSQLTVSRVGNVVDFDEVTEVTVLGGSWMVVVVIL